MSKQIFIFINIFLSFILYCSYSLSAEITIIPLKKPILSPDIKEKKITQNIIKPKSKPKPAAKYGKNLVPEKKPKKKITTTKQIQKADTKKKTLPLRPKKKPLYVKKQKKKFTQNLNILEKKIS